MEQRGLLVVSFGTAYPEALERDLVPVERAILAALPEYTSMRAFTSGSILKRLRQQGLEVPTVGEALERLRERGVRELVVQPTFLVPGREYALLLEEAAREGESFSSLLVGRPLLGREEDCVELAAGLAACYPREKGPVVLMGHGTESAGHGAYSALAAALPEHLQLGVMEGEPGPEAVCRRLRAAGAERVTLAPLLLTAGGHVCRQMASGQPDSWKSRLEASGIRADPVLRGLGSLGFVRQLFARHALEAVTRKASLDIPEIDDKLEVIR